MKDLSDFVLRLTAVLDRLALPYMFVGSAASTLHGPPRSTQDIDLVVALTLEDVDCLVGHHTFQAGVVAVRGRLGAPTR